MVLPAYPPEQDLSQLSLSANEGSPIRYLISAPTMRVPADVSETINAYLAFRAVLQAGMAIIIHELDKIDFVFSEEA